MVWVRVRPAKGVRCYPFRLVVKRIIRDLVLECIIQNT